jgi:hypothetical protein
MKRKNNEDTKASIILKKKPKQLNDFDQDEQNTDTDSEAESHKIKLTKININGMFYFIFNGHLFMN